MMEQPHVPEEVLKRLKRERATTRIAVVGASNNPEKYGNIIVKNLTQKGYTVIPINPREKEIAGLVAYQSVSEAPGPIHIVNFVTPPKVSAEVVRGIKAGAFETAWFQEGSFDDEVLALARERFTHVVHGACIMMVTNLVMASQP